MVVCVFYIAFCTRDRGCSAHSAFPAPSTFQGVKDDANLGRIAPRECETVSGRHCEEHLRRSNPACCFAAPKLDCFRLRPSSYGGQVASLAMTISKTRASWLFEN